MKITLGGFFGDSEVSSTTEGLQVVKKKQVKRKKTIGFFRVDLVCFIMDWWIKSSNI
jgi:hypothetical protein